ncbi:MAG TPA: glycosyltransferase 87 family protein [Trebonia sp.]|nr:glycosyltransferase 87 family protein [Trebonia sp.]
MGGVRLGADFESPAAMPRRWLAGIFAICMAWAILVAIFTTDHVHQLWGEMAAVGYGIALVIALALRHPRTADLAVGAAFLGALLVPLGALAAQGLMQPEVWVVADSGASLIQHGTPYTGAAALADVQDPNAYNPYLPVMALFGLPRAFFDLGLLTDPRVWFGVVFLAVFWLALRHAGARDPGRWTFLVAGTPVIAFELAVGGTDVPMVGFLCLGFGYLWVRQPALAGLALGIGAAMKATAWPALLVAVSLLAVRDGKRAAGAFSLTALGVVAACVGPFIIGHPKALVVNTIMFPLGLASVRSAASSPLPGHIIASAWPNTGHTIVVVLLALAGAAVAASLVFRPPRSVPRAVMLLAGAMTLMFVLAPSTRFGYFIYPAALTIWLFAGWAGRKADENGELGEIAVGFLPARVPESPPPA